MIKFDKNKIIFLIILAIFLISHFLGLGQIYHQDEHRWAMQADPKFSETSPHPPLTLYLLRLTGLIAGFENLRWLYLIIGILNLVLVYLVSKKISKSKTVGLISASLFTVNVYSLIAGLQIDIDGLILPFFVLAGYYAYSSLREGRNLVFWTSVLLAVVAGGFLAKLSFILFIGAIVFDSILDMYADGRLKPSVILRYAPIIILPSIITGGFFYYFNADQASIIFKYGTHFKSFNFSERAYFELGFKLMKSLVWLSPLLSLPVLYGLFKKEILYKYKFWYTYLFINSVFYLIIFDFARLTIERYFMFMIVPAVIISGEIIRYLYKKYAGVESKSEWMGAVGIFLIFSVMVFGASHVALPLNPKNAYVDQIRHFNLNFLIPLSGGSGPIGFYFSAKFIFLSWLLSGVSILGLAFKNRYNSILFSLFLIFGFGYNAILANEYISGSLYGSPAKVARESLNYVLSHPDIKEVITYNDIGAYELKMGNKYLARFYTAPTRDYTQRMERYRGHYLVVDFPAIGEQNIYWQLLSRCLVLKNFQDNKVRSYIFDCSNIE